MRPDSRSVSFTFHREAVGAQNSSEVVQSSRNSRQRLQDRFDKEKSGEKPSGRKVFGERDYSEKIKGNLSFGNVSIDSRRALRSGAEKLSKTLSSVRTTFGTITQRFRSSTCRRQRLDECRSPGDNASCTSQTPQTRSRCLLGRTPTKLYSPFGIESPRQAWNKENDYTEHHTAKVNEERRRLFPFRFSKTAGFSTFG